MTSRSSYQKVLAIVAGIAAAVLGSSVANAQEVSVQHGKALAETNCAKCHATGLTGDSPHEKAPPFRTLGSRFPVDTVDEALLAKLSPKHSDMPTFEITPGQARDIAAYIASIQPVAHGEALVVANCSPCHAIGKTGDSPHSDAPPFRTLSERYPIDALEEAFAEGIETGHPDMPSFSAEPEQIADILAYIWSVQAK
ncbi:MAG: cytochrome c [Nitratireductor sp.]